MRAVLNTKKIKRTQAGALVIVLVLTAIIVVGVGSYAVLVATQNRSAVRDLAWNNAIPVAEAGIEEALTQLYYRGTNAPTNGWTITNNIYYKTRALGTNGSYYQVKIQPSTNPVVTATAYVLAPNSTTNYISRVVQVKTAKNPAPKGGIVARGTVNISGGAYLDSYDSADPNYSTNGLYTATKKKANGLLVTNSKVAGAVSLSASPIYGEVDTGPGGTVTMQGSAKIGDYNWITNGSTSGIQSGHTNNNANVDFPAVVVPPLGAYYSPSAGAYSGTNYSFLLNNATYYTSSKLTVPGGGAMAIVGNVVLKVDNDFTTSGSGFIYMYPGSTLKIYVNGQLTISGGGIVNSTQNASALTIYGITTSPSTWTYSGSAQFIGSVYATNANFTFSGGQGASGQFTVNSAVISGSAGIHYDENLAGLYRGYMVQSWNEL
jgi:Tfp pilus assembly protein PilX